MLGRTRRRHVVVAPPFARPIDVRREDILCSMFLSEPERATTSGHDWLSKARVTICQSDLLRDVAYRHCGAMQTRRRTSALADHSDY